MALKLAISPCPNDTFAFHQMIESGRYDVTLADVEELNQRAERGEAEITKLSVGAFGFVRERYALLRAGGAAGFGVGPIVVAREPRDVGGNIAVPGLWTTAALLLRQLGMFDTSDIVPMRFDRIEHAVLRGDVDCGVLIHEGRFTYESKGLVKLADLGELWDGPIPLGAIAIRRDLLEHAAMVDVEIRASVEHALAHPDASAAYVRENAQEMDPDVVRQHIGLYVNDYTLALDETAVFRLLAFGDFPPCDKPVFATT